MGNHIVHSIKHIKYELFQQKEDIQLSLSLVLKWFGVVNTNDKEKFRVYVFRIIVHLFDLDGYFWGFDT